MCGTRAVEPTGPTIGGVSGTIMGRKPNPLLEEFLDRSIPLPPVRWETVPAGVDPHIVWEAYDEGIEGWVPVWFPTHEPVSGRTYGEFERAHLFNEDLERILKAMHRWPLWGTPAHRKHAVAIALLQLFCELEGLCEKV